MFYIVRNTGIIRFLLDGRVSLHLQAFVFVFFPLDSSFELALKRIFLIIHTLQRMCEFTLHEIFVILADPLQSRIYRTVIHKL